jgi:hypothetical protein
MRRRKPSEARRSFASAREVPSRIPSGIACAYCPRGRWRNASRSCRRPTEQRQGLGRERGSPQFSTRLSGLSPRLAHYWIYNRQVQCEVRDRLMDLYLAAAYNNEEARKWSAKLKSVRGLKQPEKRAEPSRRSWPSTNTEPSMDVKLLLLSLTESSQDV